MRQTKYLRFEECESATGKTVIVTIWNRNSGTMLGQIRWYGPWRQYCWFPTPNTIFNVACMKDIEAEIDRLRAAR